MHMHRDAFRDARTTSVLSPGNEPAAEFFHKTGEVPGTTSVLSFSETQSLRGVGTIPLAFGDNEPLLGVVRRMPGVT